MGDVEGRRKGAAKERVEMGEVNKYSGEDENGD